MTEEKNVQKKKVTFIGVLLTALAAVAVLGSGVFAAFLICLINHAAFGTYLWQLIVSVDLAVFATVGFFMTEGKRETFYGVCSIAGIACAVMQMAMLF